jgi:molybdopterin-synthase adenylyltransferase
VAVTPLTILPRAAASRLESYDGSWGQLDVRHDRVERLAVVCGTYKKGTVGVPTHSDWGAKHFLRHADAIPRCGWWYKVDTDLSEQHRWALNRALCLPTEVLHEAARHCWQALPPNRLAPVLTLCPTAGGERIWLGWAADAQVAWPSLMEVVDDRSPLSYLGEAWPVEELSRTTALVIGVGSIGCVAAEILASYAVGNLVLVDNDRLFQHNLVRHRLGLRHLGRLKVNGMAEQLRDRYPGVHVEAFPVDAVFEADLVRGLLAAADIVVGATDGVASRRVINHLARRANVPAVLACVLEEGALGEVVRVRPGTGCLLCYRSMLHEQGSLDPEPLLDQDYGLGSAHLPMTAVAGDLATVGTLAAKVAVATVLENRGDWGQRLPGDVALVGLRPVPGLEPPFDVEQTTELRWSAIGSPRSGCPTCSGP